MDTLSFLIRWIHSHPQAWGWIVLGSVSLAIIYAGAILLAVTRMNPDYFSAPKPAPGTLRRRYPLLILTVKVLKTLVGLVLLSAGIGMLVFPGQGLATIAIGIGFMEFPGKRKLLSAVVFRTGVIKTLNRLREKAGKEPLRTPEGH